MSKETRKKKNNAAMRLTGRAVIRPKFLYGIGERSLQKDVDYLNSQQFLRDSARFTPEEVARMTNVDLQTA